MSMTRQALVSLTWIGDRRQAFAKLSLLTFGVALLIRLACLLLRARCWRCATRKHDNRRGGHQKQGNFQPFHESNRIIKRITAATFKAMTN